MPDATFLHVETPENPSPRVIELAGSSIRVGSGPQCEVRLFEPALAEVQCLLVRRGASWRVQPVGPPGRISIDGRPVEQARSLPLGVPMRVGSSRLTLRSGALLSSTIGGFAATMPADPDVHLRTNVPPADPMTLAGGDPGPSSGSRQEHADDATMADEHERLERWRARLESRERSLRNRAKELRWEARWRAVGEDLRGRRNASPVAPRPGGTDPPRRPTPDDRNDTRKQTAVDPGAVATPLALDAPTPTGQVSPPPGPPPEFSPQEPPDRGQEPEADPLCPVGASSGIAIPREASSRPVEEGSIADPGPDPRNASLAGEPEPSSPRASLADEEPQEARDDPRRPEFATAPESDPSVPPYQRVAHDEPPAPSVRDVLDGLSAQDHRTGRSPTARPSSNRPMPTVDVAPAAWKVPGRVALPCVLVLTLTIGLATFRLSWTWAAEDLALAGLCNTLLKPGPIPPTPIELPAMREPRWWSTTSGHLLLRALAARFGMPAPDRVGESHGLLEMAHGLSPLDRSVRLNLIASGAGRAPFGVSRDAVALHLQGNRLRDAGRNDEAVACYARALAIAATSEPEDAPSHFFEDPLARFALPLEGRMTEIVRDLLIACRDAPDRWAEALPSSPLAALAAFRILRDERDPSAARAGELVLESGDPEDGVPGALRLAAQGEVLALEGRLPEAAERYREAISRELPEAIRRLLAFNLSDIEARLGNHRAMVEAWDLARGADLHDPINVRLAEARIRRSRSLPATPGVRGKAATDAVLRATHERPAPFRP